MPPSGDWVIWGGRWEVGGEVQGGGGGCVYLWLIHVAALQKLTQYCKAIILQLKKRKNVEPFEIL